jgi:hypothetical protein
LGQRSTFLAQTGHKALNLAVGVTAVRSAR